MGAICDAGVVLYSLSLTKVVTHISVAFMSSDFVSAATRTVADLYVAN